MSDEAEIEAIRQLAQILSALDSNAVARVIKWAAERYGITVAGTGVPTHPSGSTGAQSGTEKTTEDLPDLYAAANPGTDAEKALVVAYWFQEVEAQRTVDAQQINAQLKHLGHGVKNITSALTDLKDRKPSLVIQTQKSGPTKQARKKYRVTTEGVRRVRQMLSAKTAEERG